MSHEVSIDPIDDSGINFSNLEQRRNLWVPGTAIHPDHFSHPPVASIEIGLTPQKATEGRAKAAVLVGHTPVPCQTGWDTEPFNVKRLLLPPLLRIIPAAQATDAVKCEAMNKAYGRLTIGLLASAIALAPLPTKAQVATSENIAEKLSSAFGNQGLFDSIAVEFVDKANASLSCKWWVMKANHQHQLDFRSLQTTPQEVHQHIMGQMQGNMVEFTFPAINKACTD